MKSFVPDREKWANYFLHQTGRKKQPMVTITPRKGIIPIETNRPGIPKKEDVVKIEAITPVQQLEERVKSELERTRKRKLTSDDALEQSGGSTSYHTTRKKRLVSRVDTSGF